MRAGITRTAGFKNFVPAAEKRQKVMDLTRWDCQDDRFSVKIQPGRGPQTIRIWTHRVFVLRLWKELPMRKLIQRRALHCGVGRGGVSPFIQIHQKKRISIDIDILSYVLDFFPRQFVHFYRPFHLPQFTNNESVALSGQVRGILCYFSGCIREFAGLMFRRPR